VNPLRLFQVEVARAFLALPLTVLVAVPLLGLAKPATAPPTAVWSRASIPGIATSEPPTGEDFKGRFYVASLSTDAPEDSRIQLSSTPLTGSAPSWTTTRLIPGSDPNSSITIKAWKSRLWLAFRAQNQKIYVTSSADAIHWDAYQSILVEEFGIQGSLSLKGLGSRLYLAALDSVRLADDSRKIVVASRTLTGGWSALKAVPGLTSKYRPALTELNNKLTLGIVGTDGRVHLNTSGNGTSWAGWKTAPAFGLGGENHTTPLVANRGPGLTVWRDKLQVGVRIGDFDTEDSLHIATFDRSSWTPWEPKPPFGPTLDGEPCLTTAGGDLFIVTQGWDASSVLVERRR